MDQTGSGSQGQPLAREFSEFRAANRQLRKLDAYRKFSGVAYQHQHFAAAAWYASQVIEMASENVQGASQVDYERAYSYNYGAQRYQAALGYLEHLAEHYPDNPGYHRLSGLCHQILGDFERAKQCYLRSDELRPDNLDTCDGLAHVYGLTGRPEKAAEYGTRALQLKDAIAHQDDHLEALRRLVGGEIRLNPVETAFDPSQPARNVIAFSLWGQETAYTQGAILNATVAPAIYPGWSCRFYCDESVPELVLQQLRGLGADVRVLARNKLAFFGLFWRFFVADDPEVRHFLVRDCDCVLNCQERVAVDEWLASGKTFHVMRDYYSHTELIHAGMWGGVAGAVPGIQQLIVDFYDKHEKERTIDQRFLRKYLWPFVRQSYLCHDTHFRFDEARQFPDLGRYPSGTGNVGKNWQVYYGKASGSM